MPLARIITQNPDDAAVVHEYLAGHGYEVEFADPSALNLPPADLEVNLERLPLEEGLRQAAEWAESSGADVYIASGAIAPLGPPAEIPEAPADISSYVPLTFAHPEPDAQDLVASETEEVTPIGPSLLERWNRALAERRAARQERKAREREAARVAQEQRALREAQAAALAREMREQAAQREAARPAIVHGAAVRAAQPAPAPRPALQAVTERRMNSARRGDHGSDIAAEYWKGAFTGAAAVAIILMIAWATLGSTHPSTPASTSGQIKQDVPFGPVTLTPGSAPARPAPSAAAPAPQTPVHAVTPAPKPIPVHTHSARRAPSHGGAADDEVVVHHYGRKPAAATTTAKSDGVKRISDQ